MNSDQSCNDQEKYKSILVIGNGFDIRHGLPTRYTDFMSFVQYWSTFYDIYSYLKADAAKEEPIHIDADLTWDSKIRESSMKEFGRFPVHYNEREIQYLEEHLRSNVWIKHFESVQQTSDYNWVDFESEIQRVVVLVDGYFDDILKNKPNRPEREVPQYVSETIQMFEQGINDKNYQSFSVGVFKTRDYKDEILERNKKIMLDYMASSLEELTECFRLYLKNFVSRIKDKGDRTLEDHINPDYILSFNYTETVNRMWDESVIKHYVHGNCSCSNEKVGGNIVLGIDDNQFGDNLDHVRFQKYYQRIIKKTGGDYRAWIQNEKVNVSFIGFSFSKMDESIIKDFFDSENVLKIIVYYLRQVDLEQYAYNLIAIFDKEKIIKWIGDERIVFEKIDDYIENNSVPLQ